MTNQKKSFEMLNNPVILPLLSSQKATPFNKKDISRSSVRRPKYRRSATKMLWLDNRFVLRFLILFVVSNYDRRQDRF